MLERLKKLTRTQWALIVCVSMLAVSLYYHLKPNPPVEDYQPVRITSAGNSWNSVQRSFK